MKIQIVLEPDAEVELDALDAWWREHRRAVASQVADEFSRALDVLRATPEIGRPYNRGGVRNIRWLLMRKTPYKLFYHYEPGSDVVTIVAAWSSARKRGPRLKK